jgi:hypothetical protein
MLRFGLRFWLFLPTPPPRLLLPPFSSLSAPSAPPPAERAWDFVSPESGKLKLYMSAWPRMDGRRNGKRREACCVAGLMKKLRGSRQPWAWLWMPLMMAGARRLYVQGLKERRVQRRAFRRAEAGEKARGFSLRSYPSAHAVASRSCACGESETNDDSSLFFHFHSCHLCLIAPAFQPWVKMNRLCTPTKVSVTHVNGRRECAQPTVRSK